MDIFTPPQIKEKSPPGRPSKCSVEYQVMIAKKVVEEGMTYREAAKTFNVSHGAVHSYIKKYKHLDGKIKRTAQRTRYADRVEDYRHEAQLKGLKQEIADLYLENLMLKKALQHSLQMKKEDSSVITSENLERLKEVVR